MKVFLPVATQQNLLVMPRESASSVDVLLRQVLGDISTSYTNITTTFTNGYLTIPLSHSFLEGETYEITVTKNSDGSLLWRGQAFVTAQAVQNYKEYA